MTAPPKLRQRVQFVTASDGIRLAWARVWQRVDASSEPQTGSRTSNTNGRARSGDTGSVLREHWRFIRSDERGCGMSEWNAQDLTLERWVADLETIIDAARPVRAGHAAGTVAGAAACILAIRHPERVARWSSTAAARGKLRRGMPALEREYRAMLELARAGWGRDNPAFRQVFTSRFIPGGDARAAAVVQRAVPKDDDRRSIAGRLARGACGRTMYPGARRVRTPTLVLHARGDEVTAARRGAYGRGRHSRAPQFVELDSRNHILLEHEPRVDALPGGGRSISPGPARPRRSCHVRVALLARA